MTLVAVLITLVIALPLLLIVAGQLGALAGSPPSDLGLTQGRLKPPARTPNSVSSQTALHPSHPQAQHAAIAPLRYRGSGAAAMDQLAGILRGMERTVLVTQTPGYLYAQCSTKLLRFTDDVEFSLDEAAGVIHLRSASRIGHGDLGLNRTRIEAIRQQLERASP